MHKNKIQLLSVQAKGLLSLLSIFLSPRVSSNGCYGNGLKNMKSDLAYLLIIISILGNRLRRQKSITDGPLLGHLSLLVFFYLKVSTSITDYIRTGRQYKIWQIGVFWLVLFCFLLFLWLVWLCLGQVFVKKKRLIILQNILVSCIYFQLLP